MFRKLTYPRNKDNYVLKKELKKNGTQHRIKIIAV